MKEPNTFKVGCWVKPLQNYTRDNENVSSFVTYLYHVIDVFPSHYYVIGFKLLLLCHIQPRLCMTSSLLFWKRGIAPFGEAIADNQNYVLRIKVYTIECI